MFSSRGKYLIALAILLVGFRSFCASFLGQSTSSLKFNSFKNIKADSWSVVGQNMIVEGNVYIPFGNLEVFADRAIINIQSRDIEAVGNIQFYRWNEASESITPERLGRLETAPNVKIEIVGVSGNEWGDQLISVKAAGVGDNLRAGKLVGNLDSGFFQLTDAQMRFKTFVCRAEYVERHPDGVITVKNADVSSCEYLESNNGHFSIGCASATLTPHATPFYGIDNIDSDIGDHTIFMTNGFFKVYGVPVLWLPVFYKPKDESLGLVSTQWGKSSDWGFFMLMSRRFMFSEYPYVSLNLMADIYTARGFGYGAEVRIGTEESKTNLVYYSIYDSHPYRSDDYDLYRLEVPKFRYILSLSNVTHITPRLDFRGTLTYMSDYYFSRDFFNTAYNDNPEPSTYAALEQQFDHFSASIYVRAQVNHFYTTVQRLPGIRFDIQRQEILDTNIYYQGDLSMDYLKMNWIKFGNPEWVDEEGNPTSQIDYAKLQNYESFRFDTTHFLYYPIRFDWLNLVPRAGFKLTAYSNSSDMPVKDSDLFKMQSAADPESRGVSELPAYDDEGGSKFRFIGELGMEASTKIYNTWQDVRSAWLGLDGLRHVMRPYLNYTFIPKPTEDRDYLYYFDDIDRIDEQHFVRLGVDNRLQTRSGNAVRDYLTMENYWDFHFDRKENFSNIGDFCTILTATPFKGFQISTEFSIDAGGNNDELPETVRNGRNAGHPGLNLKWLNRWNLSLTYVPAEDFKFTFAYVYNRPYASRSAYSMGATLTQLDAGSFFDKYFSDHTEQITFGMSFPITPDRRTFGAYSISYDVLAGYVDSTSFRLIRNFHCWELSMGVTIDCDGGEDKEYEASFDVSVYLTGLSGPLQQGTNSVLGEADRQMRKGVSRWTGSKD